MKAMQTWWKAVGVRAVKTMAQTAVATIDTVAVLGKVVAILHFIWYNKTIFIVQRKVSCPMDAAKTYCNPIPLPDYPIGRNCYIEGKTRMDYRETADPTVLYEDGKWYLYPSCGMVYWSEDFTTWQHQKMEPYDCGYAPTVVKHGGKFYLLASLSELYESESPMGPFTRIGPMRDMAGREIYVYDPMLFSDTDGSLYLYCDYGNGFSIKAARVDPDNPTQLITPLEEMFSMNTEEHFWERMGDWNEDGSHSAIEGAWMYKRGDTYYLTYSGPGTEWTTYAMGAYKGKSPLGPWEYMKTSPFMMNRNGLVRGPGHGCIVDGPNNTVWAFYTCCMCYAGEFERRIGYDPIGFDKNGDIIATASSEIPQWVPGMQSEPDKGNAAGLVPVTQHKRTSATSSAPGRDPVYATDDSLLSWWQPASEDASPALTVQVAISAPLDIYSARIIWRDVGLDIKKGVFAGAFAYKIEAEDADGNWICVLDRSESTEDLVIDYRSVQHMKANRVRLVLCKWPDGIAPGVVNFTVFGRWEGN